MYALVMIIYTATYAINSAPGGAMVRGSNPVISYTITNVANFDNQVLCQNASRAFQSMNFLGFEARLTPLCLQLNEIKPSAGTAPAK